MNAKKALRASQIARCLGLGRVGARGTIAALTKLVRARQVKRLPGRKFLVTLQGCLAWATMQPKGFRR